MFKNWDDEDAITIARNKREADLNFFKSCFERHTGFVRDEPPPWLIEDLLPQGYLMLLSSDVKQGKSAFVSAIALSVLTGDNFAERRATKGAVLWCANEESYQERMEVQRFDARWTNPSLPMFSSNRNLPSIDSEQSQNALRFLIQQEDIKLIVIDPLYGGVNGLSLQESHYARRAMQGLKNICNDTGVSIIVIHQSTTRGRLRAADSIQLEATASMDAVLTHRKIASGRVVTLRCQGRGDFANATHQFFSEHPQHFVPWDGSDETADQKAAREATENERQVTELLAHGPIGFGEIGESTQINLSTLRSIINRLLQRNQIEVASEDNGARLYRLNLNDMMQV